MASPKPRETEMHTLYLSNTVWGELKRRTKNPRGSSPVRHFLAERGRLGRGKE